jgi:hypothetical protein
MAIRERESLRERERERERERASERMNARFSVNVRYLCLLERYKTSSGKVSEIKMDERVGYRSVTAVHIKRDIKS